ncbi:MAG: hypothetical protein PHP65_06415, partial [Bacilli bacterium]|nr:hypothetical protein [Bacilli bacterium]
MINFAGTWSELSDLNAALTNNWLIKGLVIDADTRAVSTLNALTEPIRNYSQGTLSIDPNFNTFVERNNTVNNDFYYNIYRNENLIKTTTNLSYTEEIFNTGVYNYCVEYVKGDCISSQVCETVNIENLSCGTPTMQLTDYSDQSGYKILVSTNNIPEAVLYRFYNENNELLYEISSAFSGVIFTATPGVNYCFKMTSVCVFNGDSIESDYSNQECMVVDCYESPVAYFMQAEGKKVYINWSRNAASYTIYKNGEVYAENFSSSLGFGVGSYDLIEGETYCFQIASLCNSGDTLWSNEICYTVPQCSVTTNFTGVICSGENYLENGFSLINPTSGTYTQNLLTSLYCDSTVVLNLTVNPVYNEEIYETVCNSYTWNNQNYTESGDYIQYFQTVAGCDSTVTLHLTVNYPTTNEFSEIACDSYSWNNQVYTESGDYIQHFQTVAGCDSTVTLHLIVNYSTTNEFSVTACNSYSWNNQVYTESDDYIQQFQTVAGCDSMVTLHLTINNSTIYEFYETVCDSYTWNNQVYTQSGNYPQQFIAANGCDSTVTLYLTVNYSSIVEFS